MSPGLLILGLAIGWGLGPAAPATGTAPAPAPRVGPPAVAVRPAPAVGSTPGPAGPLAAVPVQATADAWVAEDKLRHLAMSFALTTFGYGAARAALAPEPAAAVAAATAAAAGLAKEALDRSAGRRFSGKDLLWDAAGIAAALTLADRIQ